jgi:predicted acyl esterase
VAAAVALVAAALEKISRNRSATDIARLVWTTTADGVGPSAVLFFGNKAGLLVAAQKPAEAARTLPRERGLSAFPHLKPGARRCSDEARLTALEFFTFAHMRSFPNRDEGVQTPPPQR